MKAKDLVREANKRGLTSYRPKADENSGTTVQRLVNAAYNRNMTDFYYDTKATQPKQKPSVSPTVPRPTTSQATTRGKTGVDTQRFITDDEYRELSPEYGRALNKAITVGRNNANTPLYDPNELLTSGNEFVRSDKDLQGTALEQIMKKIGLIGKSTLDYIGAKSAVDKDKSDTWEYDPSKIMGLYKGNTSENGYSPSQVREAEGKLAGLQGDLQKAQYELDQYSFDPNTYSDATADGLRRRMSNLQETIDRIDAMYPNGEASMEPDWTAVANASKNDRNSPIVRQADAYSRRMDAFKELNAVRRQLNEYLSDKDLTGSYQANVDSIQGQIDEQKGIVDTGANIATRAAEIPEFLKNNAGNPDMNIDAYVYDYMFEDSGAFQRKIDELNASDPSGYAANQFRQWVHNAAMSTEYQGYKATDADRAEVEKQGQILRDLAAGNPTGDWTYQDQNQLDIATREWNRRQAENAFMSGGDYSQYATNTEGGQWRADLFNNRINGIGEYTDTEGNRFLPNTDGYGDDKAFGKEAIDFITPEQKDKFDELYQIGVESGDWTAVNSFLDVILPQAEYAMAGFNDEATANEYEKRGPVWGSLHSLVTNVDAGLEGISNMIGAVFGKDIKAYGMDTASTRETQWLRQQAGYDAGEQFAQWFGEDARRIGENLYGVLMSVGDNLVAMLAGTGLGHAVTAAGGSVQAARAFTGKMVQWIMSSTAASNTYYKMAQEGADPEETIFYSVSDAMIEWITEKWSIERLFSDPTNIKRYLMDNFLAEGSEEVAGKFAGTLVDFIHHVIYGNEQEITADYNARLDAIMSNDPNMDPEKAKRQALGETIGNYVREAGDEFIAGGLAGLILSGSGAAYSYGKGNFEVQKVGQQVNNAYSVSEDSEGAPVKNAQYVVEAGLSMPGDSKSKKLAEKIAGTKSYKNNKSVSNYQLGRLAQELYTDVNRNGRAVVHGSVRSLINSQLGSMDSNLSAEERSHLSGIITSSILDNSYEMSKADRKALTSNQSAFEIYKSFVSSNSAEDTQFAALAKDIDSAINMGNQYRDINGKLQLITNQKMNELYHATRAAYGTVASQASIDLANQNKTHNASMTELGSATGKNAGNGNVVVNGKNGLITGVTYDSNTQELQFQFTASDGSKVTVSSSDIKTGNAAIQSILSFADINPNLMGESVYSAILTGISNSKMNTKVDAGDIIRDASLIYNSVFTQQSQPDLKTMSISEDTYNQILEQAKKDAETYEKNRISTAGTVKRHGSGKILYADGFSFKDLNEEQRSQVDALSQIGQAIGYNFELYNGENQRLGSYNPETGAIRIDVTQAEADGRHSLLVAAGHELTHFIEHNSPVQYAALREAVIRDLKARGLDFNAQVQEKMDREAVGKITYGGAVAEVIADACQNILVDSKAIETLAKRNPALKDDMQGFMSRYTQRIDRGLKGIQLRTKESQLITSLGEYNQEIARLWDAGLIEAVEKTRPDLYDNIESNAVMTESKALPGQAVAAFKPNTDEVINGEKPAVIEMPEEKVQNGVRAYNGPRDIKFKNGAFLNEDSTVTKGVTMMNGRDVLEYTLNRYGFEPEQIAERLKFMDEIAGRMEEWGVKYRFLNLEEVNNATLVKGRDGKWSMTCVVKNAEYPINIDFSTICDKRADMTKLFNDLARTQGKKAGMSALQEIDLSPKNIRRINQILKEAGYETACFGCFVEAKRFEMQKFASEFCDMWNNIVDELAAQNGLTDIESFDFAKGKSFTTKELDALEQSLNDYNHGSKKNGNYVDRGGSVEKKIRTLIEQNVKKGDRSYLKYLSVQDLITSEGIKNMDIGADEMRKIFNSHWGQKRPKNIHAYVPYHSEIATFKMTRDTVTRKLATEELTQKYVKQVFDSDGQPALDKNGEPKYKVDTKGIIGELYNTKNPEGIKTEQLLVDYIKKIGGVRNQSFSDFVPTQLYDALQMLADCEARGFNGQCYTKNAYRAWLMGMCNFKTNLSVMFLIDKNVDPAYAGMASNDGKYTGLRANVNGDGYLVADYAHVSQDPNWRRDISKQVQSIGYKDATKISTSKLHAGSCGAIGVGHSYWHMVSMMNDYYIPYIIGYHRSGMAMEVAETVNLNMSADYTNVQNIKKMPDKFKVVNNWQSFNAPSYATWSMDERVAKKDLGDYTGSETPASYIHERYNATGSYVQAMKDLLTFMNENHLTLADSKNAGSGHGTFDLYADMAKTQNPRTTADNFISWCLENNTLPLFYEFADNPYYFKNLPDFSVLNLAEMDPEQWSAGAYENGDGLVYSPQQAVSMDTLLTQEGHDLFIDKAMGMLERENAEREHLFGSEDQPSDTKIKTLERIMNDPELHDRPITRDASGRIRIDNTSGVQNAMRNQNREVIPFNEDIAYQNKLYVAEMGSAIDVVEDDYRRFMTKNLFDESANYFGKNGNTITNPDLGEVKITTSGIRHIIGRNDASKLKRKLIPAIKETIQKGKIVYTDENHNGKPIDTAVIAAKITIDGDPYYAGVVVAQHNGNTKGQETLYTFHNAVLLNEKNREGSIGNDALVTLKNGSSVISILESIKDVKTENDLAKLMIKGNGEVQRSVRDSDYQRAVESGDMETAQRMVDERAEESMGDSMIRDEDGNLLKVYHGTDADFTVFDMNKGRNNMDIQGAFFSPWDIDAEGYGPNVRAFYLDIKNPAPENVAYRALNAHKGQNGAGRMAREDLIRMGYDGVNNGNEEFIAFYPEQIKSADAVTYDGNGNVIPLSERFNENNPDIRYSVRQDTAIDTREYLNNLDPNDIENVKNKELLQKYQKMYRALQEAEKRRQDLQNKLNAADGIADMNVIRSHLISAEKKVQSLREALNKFERESAFSATVRQAENFAKDVVAKGSERALQELAEAQRKTLEAALGKKYAQKLRFAEERINERIAAERWNREMREANLKIQKDIQNKVRKLKNLRMHETDYKNIREEYKPLADALVNLFTTSDAEGGDLIWSKDVAAQLISKYEMLGTNELTEDAYSDDVMEALRNAQTAIDNYSDARKTIGMSIKDRLIFRNNALSQINEAVQYVYDIIQAQNNIFLEDKKTDTATAGGFVIADANERDDYREFTGKGGRVISGMDKMIRRGNMTPEYFFRNLRNAGLTNVQNGFHFGENRYGIELMEAKQFLEATREKHGFANWGDKHLQFTTKQGRKVDLTIQQCLSLYATWKRENQKGLIVSKHLENGGFVLNEEEIKSKGIFGRQSMMTSGNRIDPADMKTIMSFLSEDQRAYADEMVHYLSTVIGEKGNRASLQLFGIRKYNEGYYFPIKSYAGNMYQRSDAGTVSASNDSRIKHASFTNSRLNNAQNAVLLEDFDTVVSNHINQMLVYSNMVVPIESFNRILNYKFETEDGSEQTVRSLITQKYGKNATEYIQQYLKDLNGGPSQDPRKGWQEKLLSLFKKSAVAGSLSVSFQQPLSYIRAAVEINPKYLTKALATGYAGSYAEMSKYSGVAVIKDMGKFDMGYGRGAIEWLKGEDPNRSKARKVYDKASEIVTILPEKMDQATWTRMWQAVKLEQADRHPELKTDSEQFLKICGERFNEVMRLTQVYDSVLVRSNNMRSVHYTQKVLTSFMAEPTLTINMLYDAYSRIKERGGKQRVAKATAAFLISAIAQAAIKAFFSARRSPDENKNKDELFLIRATQNFMSEANPIGMIPGASTLFDILSGSDVEDSAWSVVTQLTDSGEKFIKGLADPDTPIDYRWFEDTAGYVAQLFTSIPAKNLMRDMRAVYNGITGTGFASRTTNANVVKYGVRESAVKSDLVTVVNNFLVTTGWGGVDTKNSGYYQEIYEAQKHGETGKAEALTEFLTLGKGVKESSIQSGLKSAAKNDDSMAFDEKVEYMADHGMYKDEKTAYTELYKADNDGKTPYSALMTGISKNKSNDIKAAVRELKKYGYKGKDIIDKITSDNRQAYLATTGSRVSYKNALIVAYQACGMTYEQASKKIDAWSSK